MTVPVTLLALTRTGYSLPEFASRGVQMTLEPIPAASNMRRDINGNLVDLSEPQMRKYRAHLSCTDQESPMFAATSTDGDPIWPGDEFTVTTIPHLGEADAQTFTMLVTAWQIQTDEYGADVGWILDLEER